MPAKASTRRRRRSSKARRRRNRVRSSSLCVIDEDGEVAKDPQDSEEQRESKTVMDVKDLEHFVEDYMRQMSADICDVIRVCDGIAVSGTLRVQGMEIELHELQISSIRDELFRRLVLLRAVDIDEAQKCTMRRGYWLRLSWAARAYLCPFGSFEKFRDLYAVHSSVTAQEFLSVFDAESFALLEKSEWIRVVLFKAYIAKKRRRAVETHDFTDIEEMQSLYHRSCALQQQSELMKLHAADWDVREPREACHLSVEEASRLGSASDWDAFDDEEELTQLVESMSGEMDIESLRSYAS